MFCVIYNIFLTIVLTLTVGCAYYLYWQKKQTVIMAILAVFCAYLLDNTIVFCTEIIPEFADVYDAMFLQTPSVKTIYFIVLIGSLLVVLHTVIPAFSSKLMFCLIGIYGTLLICVPMISQDDWMVFLYYCTTQVLVIGISIWGLAALQKTEKTFNRGVLKRVFLYFLCMSVLVLVEDSVMIFFVDRYSGPALKINNRNYSENLLYLGLALPLLRYTIAQLKNTKPEAEETAVEEIAVPDRQQMDIYTFATAYNLTEREQEILERLLQAKSQQEISDELVIALGTVKTHIHNIYQKTDAASRNQLAVKYRDFCSLRAGEAPTARK